MSKTVCRIVTHITTLRSRLQQTFEQGQVVRCTIKTVITDTWTLVWADGSGHAADEADSIEPREQTSALIINEKKNTQENVEDGSTSEDKANQVVTLQVDIPSEVEK